MLSRRKEDTVRRKSLLEPDLLNEGSGAVALAGRTDQRVMSVYIAL